MYVSIDVVYYIRVMYHGELYTGAKIYSLQKKIKIN